MKLEIRTVQFNCKIDRDVREGLDRVVEKYHRLESVRSPLGRFATEALRQFLRREGITIGNGSDEKVGKKPPRSELSANAN